MRQFRHQENSLKIYIEASVENPKLLTSHQSFGSPVVERMLVTHGMESGYVHSNLASSYDISGTSYTEADALGDTYLLILWTKY